MSVRRRYENRKLIHAIAIAVAPARARVSFPTEISGFVY